MEKKIIEEDFEQVIEKKEEIANDYLDFQSNQNHHP